jgi:hypothetical protein
MSVRTLIAIPGAALALACIGCASQGPPANDEITRAHTLVEQADKANAQQYAAPDLQRAHDELTAAETANVAHKYDVARNYAESAAADADLASARAGAGAAEKAAHEIQRSNSTVRQEADRAADAATTAPLPTTTPTPTQPQ